MLEATPEILEQVSTLSELANTFDQAATALNVTPDEFAEFLGRVPEARRRWESGGIEAVNQLRICLTKQALAGSTQASKLLIKMHDESSAKKVAPPAAATTSTPKQASAGRAWRFVSVSDAASECGVTAKFVQNLIREGKSEEAVNKPNPVPMKIGRSGEWTVQPGSVYAWAIERIQRGLSKRAPAGLVEPAGFREAQEVPATSAQSTSSTAADALDLDVEQILNRVLGSSALKNEEKKILIALAESVRRNTDSEERRKDKIAREDVIKGYRSLGDVYCETIEASAPAKAAELLRVIREMLLVDLTAKNSAAQQILTAAICEQSNRYELPAIRQRVKDAIEGVQLLEGVA